jgi:hypothetical protein
MAQRQEEGKPADEDDIRKCLAAFPRKAEEWPDLMKSLRADLGAAAPPPEVLLFPPARGNAFSSKSGLSRYFSSGGLILRRRRDLMSNLEMDSVWIPADVRARGRQHESVAPIIRIR